MTWHRGRRYHRMTEDQAAAVDWSADHVHIDARPERPRSPTFRELHPVARVMVVLLCLAMLAACTGLVIGCVRFAVLAWYWGTDSAEWFLST